MATTTNRTDKILVVDDDARIRDLLNRYLTQEGFEVMVAEDGKALNRLLLRETVDLIVLDLMMPGEDGLSICRRLRAANDRTPIIMLTAKGEDVDRIVGLEVGADDYLGKPFNPRELLARVHAVLRRRPAQEAPGAPSGDNEVVTFGPFTFDLVLDLGVQPLVTLHAPPQGYFRWDGHSPDTLLKLREMVGEFEKPKFFTYKQSLCAHSRNTQVGCNACIDICSAQAVSSDKARQKITVNPNLCVGCGACTTVCPTGALGYAYPRVSEQGLRFKTLLSTYAKAGGKDAVLLLHSQQQGQKLVEQLGREARLKRLHGVPANVIPLALWHTASTGIDLWLSAVAQGASQVVVLATGEEAPDYVRGLESQMAVAQAVLQGLGYTGTHLRVVRSETAAALDAGLQSLSATRQRVPAVAARFAAVQEKRSTLDMALDHLITHAPLGADALPEAIALPAGAPGTGALLGSITVDTNACTLCLSCVSACPASALQDNAALPQLRFLEKNCVQCGLCATTCPENAIALVPRLLLTPARREARVLNETKPYACVRCAKPFGTLKAIEAMLGKLAGHAMFQGEALERLKMCSDCRVIDIYSAQNEVKVTDL